MIYNAGIAARVILGASRSKEGPRQPSPSPRDPLAVHAPDTYQESRAEKAQGPPISHGLSRRLSV